MIFVHVLIIVMCDDKKINDDIMFQWYFYQTNNNIDLRYNKYKYEYNHFI